MKRRLITSALPYVNNIPHLGNLIQVLSADVFARFCRSRGYDTLYVCGTDEYGTATETRAQEEGKTPRELCDYYNAIHQEIYEWFYIAFDKFGRTSTPQQTEIVQSMFLDLDAAGYIKENIIEQLFCTKCERFLADRYVRGTCPHCGCEDARGDQCENCGKLLEPTELKQPRCSSCGSAPEIRSTKHLYIDLPRIQPLYSNWMEQASREGRWTKNAVQMTQAWIRDGLRERAITRDLKWGIPIPKPGFEDKVFYVWFDAPIGYISITKALADEQGFDWKSWWQKPDDVDLFQFIGKDNIPFHTVIFPSTLIGSGQNWTKLYHMSSSEYLNYESGKFSKSRGTGVFGSDAKSSGIPADVWRFYVFYNRPEKADSQFVWKDFQEKLNGELIGNLGNLVNRTLTFVSRYYDGKIPGANENEELWTRVRTKETKITDLLEWAELKDAFHEIFALSSIANKAFQDGEPWKTRISDPEKAAELLHDLCYIIRDLMIMVHPYLPQYAQKVAGFLGTSIADGRVGHPASSDSLTWTDLGKCEGLSLVISPEIIFTPMDDKKMEEYRQCYAGSQQERKERENKIMKEEEKRKPQLNPLELFNAKVVLKIAKIVKIERHPDAEKLYIETLDDGSGTERTIVSGLVPYFSENELIGKSIIIADNLKPRKMRGVESRGMLLAGDYEDTDGVRHVEVLDCPWAAPGTPVIPEGADPAAVKTDNIDVETLFAAPITIEDYAVVLAGVPLTAAGRPITVKQIKTGKVG